jgi:hypothetical protein
MKMQRCNFHFNPDGSGGPILRQRIEAPGVKIPHAGTLAENQCTTIGTAILAVIMARTQQASDVVVHTTGHRIILQLPYNRPCVNGPPRMHGKSCFVSRRKPRTPALNGTSVLDFRPGWWEGEYDAASTSYCVFKQAAWPGLGASHLLLETANNLYNSSMQLVSIKYQVYHSLLIIVKVM